MPPRDWAYPFADAYAWQEPAQGQVATASRGQRMEGDAYLSQGSLGSLVVRGTARISDHGSLSSGMSGYLEGTGFWLDANQGVPRFALGNPAGDYMAWNGSSLEIAGTANIESGEIGGWTINSGDLTGGDAVLHSTGYLRLGTSSNIVQMSGVDATWRLWAGAAAASSAPFRVDRFGSLTASSSTITGTLTSSNLTATGGQIGGWSITTSALELGSGSTKRGIDSGSTAFYAGSATPSAAPFRVTTAGAMTATSATITGAITATSGSLSNLTISGTLTIGSGGSIEDADGSEWTQAGITLKSASGVFGDAIKWIDSGNTERGSIYSASGNFWVVSKAGTNLNIGDQDVLTLTGEQTTAGMLFQLSNGSTNSASMQFDNTNRRARFYGYIYPGDGTSTSQTSNFIYAPTNSLRIKLADAAGTHQFHVVDSADQIQFGVSSNGGLIYADADGTALGSYSGRIPIFVNGNLRYLGYYN